MTIKTSRTAENANVSIDQGRCRGCGLCARVCGMTLYMEDGRPTVDQSRLFGCVGCGQCMAVCPEGCITVSGRTLSPTDTLPLPPAAERAAYTSLRALLEARRSVRRLQDREVEPEKVTAVLEAAAAAPMGLPPSDVSVLVLSGREKVRRFTGDFVDHLAAKRWLLSAPMRLLYRPFIGKETAAMLEDFLIPYVDFAIEGRRRGEDHVLYDAPLAMLFQASPYSDPADPHIAATYAMLAGEALGLGTCMIGAVAPVLKSAAALRARYGVRADFRGGLAVIFGYPAVTYARSLRRTFADITYI